MMGSRQLVVVVETTGALGAAWPLLFTEYVEKIIRAFAEDSSTQDNASSPGMLAMVTFNSHANRFGALFQQSPWTSRVDVFLGWLNALDFNGGGFEDVAIAEALAEALWMCCPGTKLPAVTQQRHILLIAASEPSHISTPVVRPLVLFNAKGEREYQTQQWWSANAEAVSKAFAACQVSLSVIAPRQLASLRTIYNGARRNPRAAESRAQVSNQYPKHLILISEDFSEGKRAISRAAVASDTRVDTNRTAPSSSAGTGNLLTSLGPVTSGTVGISTGSEQSTMVGGTLNTDANMNPTANTALVTPAGGLGSGLSVPPLQGEACPIPVTGAQSNPSRVPVIIGDTTSAVAIPGIVQGPVTSGTARMNAGSPGLSTVVGGTLNANANMNPMANANLVSLGSNQLGRAGLMSESGASQAQPNSIGVAAGTSGTTGAVPTPVVNMMPLTSGLPHVVQSVPPCGPPPRNSAIVPLPQVQPSLGASTFAKVWEGDLIAQKGPHNNLEMLRICKLEAYRRTTSSER